MYQNSIRQNKQKEKCIKNEKIKKKNNKISKKRKIKKIFDLRLILGKKKINKKKKKKICIV